MTKSIKKRIEKVERALGLNDQGKVLCEIYRAALTPSHPQCKEAREWLDQMRGWRTNWDLDSALC